MNLMDFSRDKPRRLPVFLLSAVLPLFFVIFCSSPQSKKSDLLANCIRTFGDEVKCREMLGDGKSDGPVLSGGQNVRLYDRDFLENILKGKNRMYVVRLLDEPSDKKRKGSGETWIYGSAVSMDKKSNKPDRGLRLYFRNGYVTRVKIRK